MRIDKVETFPLEYCEVNDGGQAATTIYVKVTSTDGAVGWGEAWTRFPEATRATVPIIEHLGSTLCDAGEVGVGQAWEMMNARSYWYGHGGIASLAISGLDMALWDLQGQHAGLALVELLGGAVHAQLPVVASGHPQASSIEALVEEVAGEAEGFAGVKFGMATGSPAQLGKDPKRDRTFVKRLRETLPAGSIVAVDARAATGWNLAEAVRRIRELDEYDLAWFEEPLKPRDFRNYQLLRSKVDTAIGHGEKLWTVSDYQTLAESGAADVVGIDPARVGGITGAVRSIRAVEGAGISFNAHHWTGPINEAASLALSLASPTARVFERQPKQNDLHRISEQSYTVSNASLSASSAPGLGIRVDEKALRNWCPR